MSHPRVEQLRAIDLFEGLSDAELELWAQAAELRELEPGAAVAEQGRPSPGFNLVLEGSLEAFAVDDSGRVEPVGIHQSPTWVGAIAVLTGGVSNVRMLVASRVTLAEVDGERFIELVLAQRPVFDRIMAQVRPVSSAASPRLSPTANGSPRWARWQRD